MADSKTTTINRNDNGAATSVTVTTRDDKGETSRTHEATFGWDGNVKPGREISETRKNR